MFGSCKVIVLCQATKIVIKDLKSVIITFYYIGRKKYMKKDITKELTEQIEINVQAHINNISFPKTIEELEYYIFYHQCFNVEDVLEYDKNELFDWTVPKSSKIGDIVLFFHAKTAIQWISKLETQTRNIRDNDNIHNKKILFAWLKKAREIYKTYGGKIFAVGRISSNTYYEGIEEETKLHYGNRIWANIEDIVLLKNPIDISEFNGFLKISRQSGITMIPFNEFEKLKEIILSKNNNLPVYFTKCKIGDYSLTKIDDKNFLTLTQNYRRRFLLEADFRSYYVDYILKNLFGSKVYRECICHTKHSKVMYYVDNAFINNDKVLMLEVKLNVNNERNLTDQLEQYVNSISIDLTKKNRTNTYVRSYMYVIDTAYIYKYYHSTKSLEKIVDLDNIRTFEDIENLKSILI